MTKKNKQAVTEPKIFEIINATIKDDFCNYSYDIKSGVGIGDNIKVTGSGIIKDELREAFVDLDVHLAAIDDVFKHSKIDVKNIDKMRNHELTGLYQVTGFKMKGTSDNESVIIIGNKHVAAAGGRIELATPQIMLDKLSSYQWWNELKTAIELCRYEVEQYKNGNYTEVEEEEKVDPKQLKITDNEEEFEIAKVK